MGRLRTLVARGRRRNDNGAATPSGLSSLTLLIRYILVFSRSDGSFVPSAKQGCSHEKGVCCSFDRDGAVGTRRLGTQGKGIGTYHCACPDSAQGGPGQRRRGADRRPGRGSRECRCEDRFQCSPTMGGRGAGGCAPPEETGLPISFA